MERRGNSGYSLIELVLAIGMMTIVVGLSVSAFIELFSVNSRTNGTSYATSLARSGIDAAAASLRNDLVQFNTVPGTPLGINFDLDDLHGPVVRDGMLFYVDTNHTARIYTDRVNPQFTAGMDDLDGDGHADVFGLGLVRQSTRAAGIQDDVDLNSDGMPDDLDGDGNPDPLWTLRLVKFKNIADVSDATLWLGGFVLARDLYIRRINPAGPLAAYNIDTFRFTGNNPNALLMDANHNGLADETEIGNISTDAIINTAAEVADTDSVVITLHVAEIIQLRGRKNVIRRDISSGTVTPRMLLLYRQNGIVGLPDPTLATNIN